METMLKTYHCVYHPVGETNLVHSVNIETTNILEAVKSFKSKFPDIEPLYIMCLTKFNCNEKNVEIIS